MPGELDGAGKMLPGMGGAMDLVTGAKRVIVAMSHTAKPTQNTEALLSSFDFSATGQPDCDRNGCDRTTEEGLLLREIAPG